MSVGGPAIQGYGVATGGIFDVQAAHLSSPPFVLAGGDGSSHNLTSVTIQADGNHVVVISYFLNVKIVSAPGGLHAGVFEGATLIVPPTVSGASDTMVWSQTTESELRGYSGAFFPTAGTHTYTLEISAALGTGGLTIYDATLIAVSYAV